MFYGNKKKSQLFFVTHKRGFKSHFSFQHLSFFKILFCSFHPCNREQMTKGQPIFPLNDKLWNRNNGIMMNSTTNFFSKLVLSMPRTEVGQISLVLSKLKSAARWMENGWYPKKGSPVTLLQEVRESTPVQTRHNVVRWACALESWEVGGGGAAASGATSCQGRWMKPRGWRDQAELEGGLVQLIGTRTRVLRLKKSISPWYSSSSLGYLVHSLGNCVMTLPTETGLTRGRSCGPFLHEACHALRVK